jgi:hypothetical protein
MVHSYANVFRFEESSLMQWLGNLFLCAPIVCMVLLVFVAFLQGLSWPTGRESHAQKRGHRTGAAYALGAAFLCFSLFYHPRLELAVTAPLRQEEKEDEDDQGSSESPIRHLFRQLRRIRRGEPVDRLLWRLE